MRLPASGTDPISQPLYGVTESGGDGGGIYGGGTIYGDGADFSE